MGQLKGPQAPKYKLINRLYLVKHLQGNKIFCHLTCVTFTGKASSRTVPTLQYNRSKVYNVTYKKVCTIKLYRLLSILILVFSSSSSFLRYITTLIRFFFILQEQIHIHLSFSFLISSSLSSVNIHRFFRDYTYGKSARTIFLSVGKNQGTTDACFIERRKKTEEQSSGVATLHGR